MVDSSGIGREGREDMVMATTKVDGMRQVWVTKFLPKSPGDIEQLMKLGMIYQSPLLRAGQLATDLF